MVEVNKRFPLLWPYGMLKTAIWVIGLIIVLDAWIVLPKYHGGIGLIYFTAFMAFLVGLFSWLAHLFGLQKRSWQVGQAYVFVPFALMDFFYAVILCVLFVVSALTAVVGFFQSFGYIFWMVFGYAIIVTLCVLGAGACGYLALLLLKAANGNPLNLRGIVIEGSSTGNFQSETTAQSPHVTTMPAAPSLPP